MNKLGCIRWSAVPVLMMTLCMMTACSSKTSEPDITAPSTTAAETDTENTSEMSAGEPDLAAFEKFISANTGKAVLARHRNYEYSCDYFEDGQDKQETLSGNLYYYSDYDFFVQKESTAEGVYVDKTQAVYHVLENGEFYYLQCLYESPESAASVFETDRDEGTVMLASYEELVETADKGNGSFVAVTEISDADIICQRFEDNSSYYEYAYSEGMRIRMIHIFDTKTLDLLSIDEYLTDADGVSHHLDKSTYNYDADAYEPTGEGEPFEEFFAAIQDPEKTRTISITYASNTDHEQTEESVLLKGASFCAYYKGDYVWPFYTDPDCTQEFEGSDGNENLKLYVPETEESDNSAETP